MKTYNPTNAIAFLGLLTLVGYIGIRCGYENIVLSLMPIYILVVLGIMLYYQVPKSYPFYSKMYQIFLAGFLFELSLSYLAPPALYFEYGTTLGPRLLSVPFLIGVFWFVLIYCTMCFVRVLKTKRVVLVLGTGILVFLALICMSSSSEDLKIGSFEHSTSLYYLALLKACFASTIAWFLTSIELPRDIHVGKVIFGLLCLFIGAQIFLSS